MYTDKDFQIYDITSWTGEEDVTTEGGLWNISRLKTSLFRRKIDDVVYYQNIQ